MATTKRRSIAAILTDAQFWVPVIALALGVVLLSIYH
jgi:hypothetical protein